MNHNNERIVKGRLISPRGEFPMRMSYQKSKYINDFLPPETIIENFSVSLDDYANAWRIYINSEKLYIRRRKNGK